jgi:hypothetical protein
VTSVEDPAKRRQSLDFPEVAESSAVAPFDGRGGEV